METSRLEHVTREFADTYMRNHPGVTRQQAKNICRPIARRIVLMQHTMQAVRKLARSFAALPTAEHPPPPYRADKYERVSYDYWGPGGGHSV